MLDPGKLRTTLIYVVELLVSREFSQLELLTRGRRVTAEEMREGVDEYPGRLMMPPGDQLDDLVDGSIIQVDHAAPPEYCMDVKLYTEEEGFSDLTLSLTVYDTGDTLYDVQIDNIEVL